MMNPNPVFWSPGMSLAELEKQAILKAYQHFKSNKSTTAASLGIAIRTLDKKLELYEKQKQEHQVRLDALEEKNQAQLLRARGIVRTTPSFVEG